MTLNGSQNDVKTRRCKQLLHSEGGDRRNNQRGGPNKEYRYEFIFHSIKEAYFRATESDGALAEIHNLAQNEGFVENFVAKHLIVEMIGGGII